MKPIPLSFLKNHQTLFLTLLNMAATAAISYALGYYMRFPHQNYQVIGKAVSYYE